MHIPSSMLHGHICPVTAAVSAAGIMTVAYFGLKAKNKPKALTFAAVTALIFAGQMMNFPILNGTSGHLLGGVLASSLLGTPFGVMAIAIVVTIQSLVFSDGGISVLGANILNMAIIGAGAGGILRSKLVSFLKGKQGEYTSIALASWISVIAASFAVSVELAIDGQISFFKVVPAMIGTHALIGIGEAVITVAFCRLLSSRKLTIKNSRNALVPLGAAGIIALLLSPFASGFPDGLESIAQKYSFLHEAAPAFVSPLSGYTFPFFSNEILSTGAAGLIGVVISFCAAWIVLKTINFAGMEKKGA